MSSLPPLVFLIALVFVGPGLPAQTGAAQQPENVPPAKFTLKTEVNRVVLDVVVNDAHGNPVRGLSASDFTVIEDGVPQTVLQFDARNFDRGMDYTPAKFPPLPPHTFVNLPADPERGPLYVLYYDLVNIPVEYQVFARKQLIKFIQAKPAGARFAIFVASDGVHMVQGFTSDESKLLAAVDASGSTPHVPQEFLMGVNFGEGDSLAAASRLNLIARYLAPMPGRKNLVWFAAEFPLSLFPSRDQTDAYREEVKKTLDLLAANQIAVYPVDASGVPSTESYAPPGDVAGAGLTSDARENGIGPTTVDQAVASRVSSGNHGSSLLATSYFTQDEIARVTGGEAIYSSNDVAGSFRRVTGDGGSYYTLTYSPTDKKFDGHLRRIHVELREKQYHLFYRRAYYGADPHQFGEPIDDALSASMKHGAPEYRQLIFGVHVTPSDSTERSTREQIASVEKPNGGHSKPVHLETYVLDYTVMAQQLRAMGQTTPDFSIAVAAYDTDGHLLNSAVNQAAESGASAGEKPLDRTSYRMEQQLEVPLTAKFLRFAVRDPQSGKIGAMEITLPLSSDSTK